MNSRSRFPGFSDLPPLFSHFLSDFHLRTDFILLIETDCLCLSFHTAFLVLHPTFHQYLSHRFHLLSSQFLGLLNLHATFTVQASSWSFRRGSRKSYHSICDAGRWGSKLCLGFNGGEGARWRDVLLRNSRRREDGT